MARKLTRQEAILMGAQRKRFRGGRPLQPSFVAALDVAVSSAGPRCSSGPCAGGPKDTRSSIRRLNFLNESHLVHGARNQLTNIARWKAHIRPSAAVKDLVK